MPDCDNCALFQCDNCAEQTRHLTSYADCCCGRLTDHPDNGQDQT